MLKYTLKRLFALIPVLIIVSIVVFMMIHLLPGDVAKAIAGPEATHEEVENIRHAYELDRPLIVQYVNFVKKMFHGNMGTSFITKRDVLDDLKIRFPNTLKLAVGAITMAAFIGIGVGVLSAVKRYSILDNLIMFFALGGLSVPPFYLGLMLILIFSVKLKLIDISSGTGFIASILPTITLALRNMALIARMTRSSMLEVLGQDYILAAKAQGFKKSKIVFGHALKNAMTSILTVIGLQFGAMMGGAVVVETVFSWPGLGRYLIDSINSRDFPVIQTTILVIALTYALVNLMVDLIYPLFNPRVKY